MELGTKCLEKRSQRPHVNPSFGHRGLDINKAALTERKNYLSNQTCVILAECTCRTCPPHPSTHPPPHTHTIFSPHSGHSQMHTGLAGTNTSKWNLLLRMEWEYSHWMQATSNDLHPNLHSCVQTSSSVAVRGLGGAVMRACRHRHTYAHADTTPPTPYTHHMLTHTHCPPAHTNAS